MQVSYQTGQNRYWTDPSSKTSMALNCGALCTEFKWFSNVLCFLVRIPYRLDINELLNRTSSQIVRVLAASGPAQEFQIVQEQYELGLFASIRYVAIIALIWKFIQVLKLQPINFNRSMMYILIVFLFLLGISWIFDLLSNYEAWGRFFQRGCGN